MEKVAVIIPPKDFKDETLSMGKLLFEKWDVKPVIASYTSRECTGVHGAIVTPDANASNINAQEFAALLLIDGEGVESYKLYDFRPLLDLVKSFNASGKVVAAIGNAIKIISRANIITDTKISTPQDEESQRLVRLYRGIESKNPVENDKKIVSARSPEYVETFISTLLDAIGAK